MNKNLTRRKMLKTSTAALGAVAGAGLLKGFPAIHAADAPVIRYLGTAVNMGDAVQKKLFDDTGIKVKFIVKTTDEVTKTIFTQPNSFDIVDSEYFPSTEKEESYDCSQSLDLDEIGIYECINHKRVAIKSLNT